MGTIDIGDKIKQLRQAQGLTLEQVGDAVGVGKSTVRKWESGIIQNMRRDKIAKLAVVLGATPEYLMGWDDDSGIISVENILKMPGMVQKPRLGAIACGTPILAEQNVEAFDLVPDWVKCDFTLECKGDSMINARIFDGDIVCVRAQPTAESGQIAVVLIDKGDGCEVTATLKRIRFQGEDIVLWPENQKYAPLVFSDVEKARVRILGVATHFISTVR